MVAWPVNSGKDLDLNDMLLGLSKTAAAPVSYPPKMHYFDGFGTHPVALGFLEEYELHSSSMVRSAKTPSCIFSSNENTSASPKEWK